MDTQPITVQHILDCFKRDCFQRLAPRTQKDYVRHLASLGETYGHRVADELRPRDFGPYMNVPKGRVQRVRRLAVLSAAFTHAVSVLFLIERNVLRDVIRPKFPPRDRLISDEEFAAFRATCPLRIKLAMDVALYTGQRQGDLLNLRWSDIKDMDVYFRQSKTGKRLAIGITPELEAVLDRCWQLPNRGEFVLNKRSGGRYTPEGFRALFQRYMRRWRRNHEGFQFRDIRPMAATKCPDPETARRLLGHSSIQMTLRVYRRGVERTQALRLTA